MSTTPEPYVQPGFVMAHLINPIVARLGGTVVLTVRGRRSGKAITVPLGRPFALDGVQYLVSGAGVTHWARNLRASGQGDLRLHGKSEPIHATEIGPGAEHDRIVAAYRVAQGRTVSTF